MRSLVFILLFITTLFANDLALESTIFGKIFDAMTAKKHPKVYIYTHNKALETFPGELQIVNNCKEADIVLLSTLKDLPKMKICKKKILFGTKYKHLRNKQVVGAFFWQKGRPNILFYDKRLKKHNINLDASFDKYIEKEN